jgi:hypothetical protein
MTVMCLKGCFVLFSWRHMNFMIPFAKVQDGKPLSSSQFVQEFIDNW